ncbi:MAG: PAS domain S-box protein [Pyrinomonadaceae bacterium]
MTPRDTLKLEKPSIERELKRTLKELSDIKFALDESAIVAITDQTGKISYVNKKFCEISKYSEKELLGEDHRIINSGFHSKGFIQSLWKTIANGDVWNGELCNRAKDGSIYWVDTTIVPFVNESGKPYQYVAIRFDITERKKAEDRIRQQASLLDKAQDAILVCDLNFQILYWNQGAQRIYGWGSDEVLGKDLRDFICGGDPEQILRARDALALADEWQSETRHLTKSGTPLLVESRWTLIRNNLGRPDYHLILNTDITEQKRVEEQLLRAQRLESIGTLAGGIAHDFNNILSPILMAIDILQINVSDAEGQRWLQMARENADRGAKMVKQVLSFARGVEGERIVVQPKHILKELIKVLVDTLPKSINLKYSIAPELLEIIADPTQIHQIFMNLAINARDAMPHGGTIEFIAQNVIVDENFARINIEAKPGAYVLVNVKDTGIGMSPDVQQRIFDPFFTTKEIGRGTGLGLSTTLSITKSHGGFINVYSELGKGTQFSVYLPATEIQSKKTTHDQEFPYPMGNGELILIVDDEENIRSITQATLEKFGYRTIVAADGTEAVAVFAAAKEQIALLLTDLAMPFMDGPATIRALRKLDPNLKLVAASGLVSNEQRSELDDLGVAAFLSKPFTAEKLLTTLAEVLKNWKTSTK